MDARMHLRHNVRGDSSRHVELSRCNEGQMECNALVRGWKQCELIEWSGDVTMAELMKTMVLTLVCYND